VPFFVCRAGAALVRGIGETVEVLPELAGSLGVLLVTPPLPVATATVFAAYDALEPTGTAPSARDRVLGLAARWRHGLDARQLARWAQHLRDANDLWPATCRVVPALAGLREGLERTLERPFLMSGSGSTLVGLYPSVRLARAAARSLWSTQETIPPGTRIVVTTNR
jgi:4-diphosphocytidyl-2-C-methyl-D-erythritol kinase